MLRGLTVGAVVTASLAVTVGAACGGGGGSEAADAGRIDALPLSSEPGEVPAEPQRDGDPAIGYDKLVNADYVSCGIPYSLYSMFFGGGGPTIPGRTGRNATLPYNYTAFTTPSGVEVVTTNCLVCHAGRINGELVIGLGAADGDFTDDVGSLAELAGNFLTDDAERAEWRKWADRVVAISGYTVTATIGVNPADNLAAVLFAHRDRDTLNWSFEPLMELPPEIVVPVDVPPWWRMQKKNAMFYDGAGRGDHARIMMSASALCTDTVDEARAIDAYFPDVRAYLLSLVPPPWPFAPADPVVAEIGRIIFDAECASCHGQYGAGREGTYPNLVVAVEDVGTDQTLALGASQFAGRYVNWFNESFYGENARLSPAPGYYAPPLDGIWSTAPFLHNGSVPTLAALLDSGTRPMYWTRNFADSTDYDVAAVGWHWTPVDHSQAAEPDAAVRKTIYDTTKLGYSNAGHTYSDALSAADRAALLEYLKTI